MSTSSSSGRYFGKYRARVEDNVDPYGRGRLAVSVAGIAGAAELRWAEACVPLSGPPLVPMGVYLVPRVGTGVWVEFEAGDLKHPIWVGCIWASDDASGVPSETGDPTRPNIVLQLGKNRIVVSDEGITLRASGAQISINASGITIDNGHNATIDLAAGRTVKINDDGLVASRIGAEDAGIFTDENAEVQCAHPPPGSATPFATNARVKVDGKSTIVVLDQYSIAGCPLNTPCTGAGFISGAARLKSGGQPLVLTDSPSTSVPNGSPLRVVSSQQRVNGS